MYAENFHGRNSLIGAWWSFVFGVRCLWRHNLTSYSCFQTNVLTKFVDTICIFLYTHSPYFICHCTEYKLLALQVRISEEKTLIALFKWYLWPSFVQPVLFVLSFVDWNVFYCCVLTAQTWLDLTWLITLTQQFVRAKMSCCAWKQESKTHSSLRQSNLLLQNEAALMSRQIRANVRGSTGWRTPWFARSNLAKLHKNWECA